MKQLARKEPPRYDQIAVRKKTLATAVVVLTGLCLPHLLALLYPQSVFLQNITTGKGWYLYLSGLILASLAVDVTGLTKNEVVCLREGGNKKHSLPEAVFVTVLLTVIVVGSALVWLTALSTHPGSSVFSAVGYFLSWGLIALYLYRVKKMSLLATIGIGFLTVNVGLGLVFLMSVR